MGGRALMASSMSRRGGWRRRWRGRGAELVLKPERDQPLRSGPTVPEWRSRGVLVRPGVGCTTDPASAAKPINRGARSGAAIRLRQMQAVVVSARYDNGVRARPGRLVKRSRSGPLRGGNVAHLDGQDMRGGRIAWRREGFPSGGMPASGRRR